CGTACRVLSKLGRARQTPHLDGRRPSSLQLATRELRRWTEIGRFLRYYHSTRSTPPRRRPSSLLLLAAALLMAATRRRLCRCHIFLVTSSDRLHRHDESHFR